MNVIEWDCIKPLYRAGYSLRKVKARYEQQLPGKTVSIEAIRRHAKKHDWKKDLKEDIKATVDRKVAERSIDKSSVKPGEEPTDDEFVEAAAELATEVVLTHRNDGKNLRVLVAALATELAADDKEERILGRGANQRVVEMNVPLKDRALTAKNLAYALSKAVHIERVSHNLDEDKKTGTGTFMITTNTPEPDPLPEDI